MDSHLLIELERPDQVEDPDDPDEPRTLRLTPSGPRWDEAAILRLEAALDAVTGPDGLVGPRDTTTSAPGTEPDEENR